MTDATDVGALARRLIRRQGHAALATTLDGAPYASLVALACDHDASPLLLLSDLAQHSRNIAFDPRVSLLIDGTADLPEPLYGPRLTLLGRAETIADRRFRLDASRAHEVRRTNWHCRWLVKILPQMSACVSKIFSRRTCGFR